MLKGGINCREGPPKQTPHRTDRRYTEYYRAGEVYHQVNAGELLEQKLLFSSSQLLLGRNDWLDLLAF